MSVRATMHGSEIFGSRYAGLHGFCFRDAAIDRPLQDLPKDVTDTAPRSLPLGFCSERVADMICLHVSDSSIFPSPSLLYSLF